VLLPFVYSLLILLKFFEVLLVPCFYGILLLPYFKHFLMTPLVPYHLKLLSVINLNSQLLTPRLLSCIKWELDPTQHIFNEAHQTLIKIQLKLTLVNFQDTLLFLFDHDTLKSILIALHAYEIPCLLVVNAFYQYQNSALCFITIELCSLHLITQSLSKT